MRRLNVIDDALRLAEDFDTSPTAGLLIDPDEDPKMAALIDAELRIVGRSNPEQEKPAPPYLPALPEGIEYTLVLDLDETLIHYKDDEDYYLVRPGVTKFLQELSTSYDIVLFTASVK
jgi:TFIIF-interacting CTD phosphatase-like protein